MVEIDILFQNKTAEKKNVPAANNHIAYIRDPPWGSKNALKIMSLAAYASETNNSLSVSFLAILFRFLSSGRITTECNIFKRF